MKNREHFKPLVNKWGYSQIRFANYVHGSMRFTVKTHKDKYLISCFIYHGTSGFDIALQRLQYQPFTNSKCFAKVFLNLARYWEIDPASIELSIADIKKSLNKT